MILAIGANSVLLFCLGLIGARDDVSDFGFQESNYFPVADEVNGEGFVADAIEAVAAVINSFVVEDEITVVEGIVVMNSQIVVLEIVFFNILFAQEVVSHGDKGDLDFWETSDDVENGDVGVGVDNDEGFLRGIENLGNFRVGIVDLALKIDVGFGLLFGHFLESGLEGFDVTGVLLHTIVHQAFGGDFVGEIFAHGDESVKLGSLTVLIFFIIHIYKNGGTGWD